MQDRTLQHRFQLILGFPIFDAKVAGYAKGASDDIINKVDFNSDFNTKLQAEKHDSKF